MGKTLVAYFSASGVTAKLSERFAKAIGADLFEIKPEVPYTDADLNWQDKNSRSSAEMNDRSSRPAISSRVENMDQYDVIFIGFPVWWYREPSIIDTFAESYDFGGKTIVPFATSGGSGIGESGKNIGEMAKDAHVYSGERFKADASEDELRAWAYEFIKKAEWEQVVKTSEETGVTVCDVENWLLDEELIKLIPKDVLVKYCALPTGINEDGKLMIVTDDVSLQGIAEEMALISGKEIELVLGARSAILKRLEELQ